MLDFIKEISAHVRSHPGKTALVDNGGVTQMTYQQLDHVSGKVYAYLKQKGIGKEQFVAITLPRGAKPIAAMIGVWKAGAAFVMLEEHYAPDRTMFILSNCNCALNITSDVWDEIQQAEYLAGYEAVDAHQAALAIYTSGSTGNPKGVLHEFGNLDRINASANYQGLRYVEESDNYALLSPLTFIAGCGTAIMCMLCGATLHVLPYETVKNPAALESYLLEKKITCTSLSPTLYRAFSSISPYLRLIILGGEPISELYSDKVQLMSAYSMSECGFMIATYPIDRPYAQTPIGKPQFDLNYWILDESGKEVPDGESGELCVDNPYIRGYIGLPEQNAAAFGKNGVYHTGDLVKRLPDGNMVIMGRLNDMIKISGNRVEPVEVEKAVKKVLGIDWCVAKGFTEGKSNFICAYYVADISVDYDKVRKQMLRIVPYYMVPSYFVKLDEIPKNANGKVDKKSLMPPKIESMRAAYAAPQDEFEEKLCRAFEEVLGLEQIGVNDDFYQLGGDSLGSMKVISESDIEGLSINDIFNGRTPKKIALTYRVRNKDRKTEAGEEDEIERERKMRLPHGLTEEQIYMVDYQLYSPKSTMWNVGGLLRFGAETDAERLAEAVNTVIEAHPALHTKFFFNVEGDIVQRYAPEGSQKVAVESVSEAEFEKIKQTLMAPFKIIGNHLYRARVFQTEQACYLFLDVHHTIVDGTSYNLLLRDINDAYSGKTFDKKDRYYELLRKREAAKKTPFYLESKAYFENRYHDADYDVCPKPNVAKDVDTKNYVYGEVSITPEELSRFAQQTKLSPNGFFVLSALLAMAKFNGTDKVKCNWTHNGRETMDEIDVVGLIIRFMFVSLHLQSEQRICDVIADVKEQITEGIAHCCYPYVIAGNACVLDDSMCMLYQHDLKNTGAMCGSEVTAVDIPDNNGAFCNVLDFEIMNLDHSFAFSMEYAEDRYTHAYMETYAEVFRRASIALLASVSVPGLTVGQFMEMLEDEQHA